MLSAMHATSTCAKTRRIGFIPLQTPEIGQRYTLEGHMTRVTGAGVKYTESTEGGGMGPLPGNDMVEARDAELLHKDTLRVEHLRDGDKAVCHEDVDLIQDGHARDHLQQHWGHCVDVLAVVQSHTCACTCHAESLLLVDLRHSVTIPAVRD